LRIFIFWIKAQPVSLAEANDEIIEYGMDGNASIFYTGIENIYNHVQK
jgi:hypothetical protein